MNVKHSMIVKLALVWAIIACTATAGFSQLRTYRQLPADNSINFGLSSKFKVEVKTCSGTYKNVYTYGIKPNESQVTKMEHIAMFGFNPAGGPVTIKVSLKNGNALTSSNVGLRNKTYKGVKTSFSGGSMLIEVCQPMKQLMVRMPGDKANPLMIHVDSYSDPAIPAGAKVKTFAGGTNGKIHEMTAQYDRYTVPNDVDVIVIEDGALFKGTIHTDKTRKTPLTVQGRGMVICREVSKPSNSIKMQYNQMELNKGTGHKIYGLTLVNGRHFAIRVSDDAHVQNIKLYGYRANNDGIVAGDDSKIENCFFKCNDDHIKLYSPRITVKNCVFYEQTNGAIFQFAWNKLTPGDNCKIENIEVLEWEANCGDPDLGQGGIARSFINHRESEEAGKVCANTTFKNIYIQGAVGRFICLNGLVSPVTYKNLTLQNVTLEQAPKNKNWIYANKADNNTTSIEINFNNVRFGNRFIQPSDFKTKGTMKFSYDETGAKYTGYLNPTETVDFNCGGTDPVKDCAGVEDGSAKENCGICWGGTTGVAKPDADKDGILDCNDECPDDATNSCNDEPSESISDINDLKATVVDCGTVKLTWGDVAQETEYRIRRKVEGESTYTTLGDVNADVTTYTDKSVNANTVYIYQVRPVQNDKAVKVSNTPKASVPACEIVLPKDCAGVEGGTASIDDCGICSGGTTGVEPNTSCLDCNGDVNGTASIDDCGICSGGKTGVEPNTSCLDCNGDVNGTASIDDCGICAGGTTGVEPNTSCLDCNGDVNGTASIDDCGVCAGGNTGIVAGESCKVEALPIPGKIEAEDFSAQNGVDTQPTTDAGVGENVGWIAAGDWMEYDVTVEKAGTYTVAFRVASAANAIKLDLKNGTETIGAINTATTGGWQTWKTVTTNVDLATGNQTLRVVATSNGWNINWIEFTAEVLPKDCAGVEGGTAKIDDCNICSGGSTGIEPNSSCRDCAGIINGAALSSCGICWGGTTGVAKPDADNDGILDCNDECPDDATNTCNDVEDIKDINDLLATAVDCKTVELSWGDVAQEDVYRVRRKIAGESTYSTLGDVAADITAYTDNTVAEGVTYIYQVRPMQNGKAVKVSNTPTVEIPACEVDETISDINDLSVTVVDCGSVELNWGDVAKEEAYRIRRKVAGGSYVVLKDVAANTTAYIDNTVAENTDYVYQVRPMQGGKAVKTSNTPTAKVPSCGIIVDPDCKPWFNSNGVWQGEGRIAISSDGNEHDKDDWAATPFSLALLASQGLQDQLVLYTYSDHIWGSNHDHDDARKQMNISALEGKEQFGFDNSTFIEAVANPSAAVSAMVAEINKSTASNPLFIIAAGPMEVVGRSLNNAQASKLQYVTVISHSKWNDRHSDNPSSWENHSGWTWDEMVNIFSSDKVSFHHIVDQNGGTGYDGMRADNSKFSWLLNHSARNNILYKSGSWQWLYERQVAAKKSSDFDPSDAGMIIYLLTGKEKTDPADAKALMTNPVAPCENLKSTQQTTANEAVDAVSVTVFPSPVVVTATVKADAEINSIKVFSASGKIVFAEYDVASSETKINLSKLAKGTYYMIVKAENGTAVKSIIKK